MKSSDRIGRLLNLVPYLQKHPGVALETVAEHFGVSASQILKEVELLYMCGLPHGMYGDLIEVDLTAAREDGIVHLSNADYLSRPMRLTMDEAIALVVALKAMFEIAPASQRPTITSALDKLTGLTGDASVVDRVSIAVSSGEDTVRNTLAEALEANRRVQLTYMGANRAETTTPVVDPHEIFTRDGAAYLRAWSLDREDWRTYRLDRIGEVEQFEQAAEDHGEPPVATTGWFDEKSGRTEVTLELQPGGQWLVEYDPALEITRDGDLVTARMAVHDPAWLTMRLVQLGSAAKVVDPPGAGAAAAELAAETLELYADWPLAK